MKKLELKEALNRYKIVGECWLWTGALSPNGYGTFGSGGSAHRIIYELLKDPIPIGLQLDHLCRTRHCVNPDHLQPITVRENILRGEGFAAINARKTHCVRGHEFTQDNTYINPTNKQRGCRLCFRVKYRTYKLRKKLRT